MVDRTTLNRAEIATLVGGDHKLIRAYEELQRDVAENLPELIEDANLSLESLDARVDVVETALTDGAILVEDEGGAGGDTHTLNFAGAGVTAAVADGVATVTIPGSTASFRGALVKKSANQTGANFTTGTAITWDAEEYDTDSIHDTVTNNQRLSVPSGVSYVRLSGNVRVENKTSGDWVQLWITKNGGSIPIGAGIEFWEPASASAAYNVHSAVLAVTGGTDYFQLFLAVESDTSIDINASQSWFAMEIVG